MPSSGDSFPCGAESTTWNQLTALLMKYLQYCFSAGLTPSMINVYVTAISVSHIPLIVHLWGGILWYLASCWERDIFV